MVSIFWGGKGEQRKAFLLSDPCLQRKLYNFTREGTICSAYVSFPPSKRDESPVFSRREMFKSSLFVRTREQLSYYNAY